MTQYSGVWNISQVAQAVQAQNWTGIVPPTIEYLIVAGGGGAGGDLGAAGGAGGLLAGQTSLTQSTQIWVTVGGGGAGDTGSANGANGGNSVLIAASSGATTGNFVALGGQTAASPSIQVQTMSALPNTTQSAYGVGIIHNF
jgi:hypothetical protein